MQNYILEKFNRIIDEFFSVCSKLVAHSLIYELSTTGRVIIPYRNAVVYTVHWISLRNYEIDVSKTILNYFS